jgi:hypothetical protein
VINRIISLSSSCKSILHSCLDMVFISLNWSDIQEHVLHMIIIPPQRSCGGYTGIGLSVRLCVHPSVCRRNGFRALDSYPYHVESPYHTYGLLIGGSCSLLILRSKGQRSSALDIKVEIQFPCSRPLSLPPRVTISLI